MSQLNVKNCPHCGAVVSANAKFCRECGKTIEVIGQSPAQSSPPAPAIPSLTQSNCPHCGAANLPTAKFCRTCGKAIEALTVDQRAAKPGGVVTTRAAIPTPSVRQSPSSAVGAASRPAKLIASTLPTTGVTTLPLGWQTVVGSTLPDIAPLVTQGVQSVISRQTGSIGRSLRTPVVGLAVTSFIAMVVTLSTQNALAQLLACLQFILTAAGLVTGLVANQRRNLISLGTVVATLGVFQLQGFMLCTLVQTATADPTPTGILFFLINGSTKFLCLITALGTAWTAARGGKR